MSDVEFENQDDHLDIRRPIEKPIEGVLVNTVLKKKISSTQTNAQYLLIGLSVVFLLIAVLFFSLFLQEGDEHQKTLEQLGTQKANLGK
jgi:hypothetical protein